MIIEISINLLKSKSLSISEAIAQGYYMEWTNERIKKAFKNGNGTINDLKRYIIDNKNVAIFMYI